MAEATAAPAAGPKSDIGISQPGLQALVRNILSGTDFSTMTPRLVRERVRGALGANAPPSNSPALKSAVRAALTVVLDEQNAESVTPKSKSLTKAVGKHIQPSSTSPILDTNNTNTNNTKEKSSKKQKKADEDHDDKNNDNDNDAGDANDLGGDDDTKTHRKIDKTPRAKPRTARRIIDDDDEEEEDDDDDDGDDNDDDFSADDEPSSPPRKRAAPQSARPPATKRARASSTDGGDVDAPATGSADEYDDCEGDGEDEGERDDKTRSFMQGRPSTKKLSDGDRAKSERKRRARAPTASRDRAPAASRDRDLDRLYAVVRALGLRLPALKLKGKDISGKRVVVRDFLRSKGVHDTNPEMLSKRDISRHRSRIEREKEMADIDPSNIIEDDGPRSRRRRAAPLSVLSNDKLPSDLSGPELSGSDADQGDEGDEYAADSDQSD